MEKLGGIGVVGALITPVVINLKTQQELVVKQIGDIKLLMDV